MPIPIILSSLFEKLGIRINNTRINSPSSSVKQFQIFFGGTHIHNPQELKKELSSIKPVINADSRIKVSDKVKVLESVVTSSGSLQMTKITKNPSKEELALVQLARGNRPYNSIFDVQINYDEKGRITSMGWNEN